MPENVIAEEEKNNHFIYHKTRQKHFQKNESVFDSIYNQPLFKYPLT